MVVTEKLTSVLDIPVVRSEVIDVPADCDVGWSADEPAVEDDIDSALIFCAEMAPV